MDSQQSNPIKIKDGSTIYQEYGINGTPLRVVILKSKKAEIYASYSLINKDLDLIIEALSALKKDSPEIIEQSITFFSIINYAKCFVGNSGGRTILNAKSLFKGADDTIKAAHYKNINLRMDYVAHAGNAFEKCAITATLYPLNSQKNNNEDLFGFRIIANMTFVSSLDGQSIHEFIDLCNYVKSHVKIKLTALESQLQGEIHDLGDKEFVKRSFIPIEEI
jgi:hypothetical protein